MNKYKMMMRYSYALQDYRMVCPKPKIIPLLYKCSLKDKLFIVKKIGILGALRLYFFEKNNQVSN